MDPQIFNFLEANNLLEIQENFGKQQNIVNSCDESDCFLLFSSTNDCLFCAISKKFVFRNISEHYNFI